MKLSVFFTTFLIVGIVIGCAAPANQLPTSTRGETPRAVAVAYPSRANTPAATTTFATALTPTPTNTPIPAIAPTNTPEPTATLLAQSGLRPAKSSTAAPTNTPIPTATVPRPPSATPSSTPTNTAAPTAQPGLRPTKSPSPSAALPPLMAFRPNELGYIMVLEYHLIEEPEARWSRTPANFRRDMETLLAEGYYPINLRDLANGHVDAPFGKTPVVLTFDDSSSGQFRYLDDETIDPRCAVGILRDTYARRPQDWALRGTFFVLLDVDAPDRILFGQPEYAERKLRELTEWGMEIGSHTISHLNMSQSSEEKVRWQLAVSENTIEELIPGYEVHSLSVPFGAYPASDEVFAGEYEGQAYDYLAAVEVAGGVSISPFAASFNPLHITRIQAIQTELDYWFAYFRDHPELRFVSDGDPAQVTIPANLPAQLRELYDPAMLSKP